MLKILLGGSPCTHWSIAQRNDSREKSPCGVGWDLFTNYQLAKEKFKPDLFLYENNKSAALKNIPRNTKLFVLSLYDGMGTGRYCFDKLGFTNVTYLAYEIDRYAISVAKKNYPDIVECGNANAVKSDYWDWRCDMYGRTKNAS